MTAEEVYSRIKGREGGDIRRIRVVGHRSGLSLTCIIPRPRLIELECVLFDGPLSICEKITYDVRGTWFALLCGPLPEQRYTVVYLALGE